MTLYKKNGTQSGMKKMTNRNKSNQMPNHGKKVIDIERMKRLSTGSEQAIHSWTTDISWKVYSCLNVSCVTVTQWLWNISQRHASQLETQIFRWLQSKHDETNPRKLQSKLNLKFRNFFIRIVTLEMQSKGFDRAHYICK